MALVHSILLAAVAGTALALPGVPDPDMTGPVANPGQWTKFDGAAKCTDDGTCVADTDGSDCFWDNEFESFESGTVFLWSYCTSDTDDDTKTKRNRIQIF